METKHNPRTPLQNGEEFSAMYNAIGAFHNFKEDFFAALVKLYGEQQADEVYSQHSATLQDVEALLAGQLYKCIDNEISRNK